MSNSPNAVLTPERAGFDAKASDEGGLSRHARSTRSFAVSRREALVGASAAALAIGIGAPDAPASAATIARATAELTDMTGHVPAYNAPIGFGRPKTSALITDLYDLIFA